jgi:hypothetical protein
VKDRDKEKGSVFEDSSDKTIVVNAIKENRTDNGYASRHITEHSNKDGTTKIGARRNWSGEHAVDRLMLGFPPES